MPYQARVVSQETSEAQQKADIVDLLAGHDILEQDCLDDGQTRALL